MTLEEVQPTCRFLALTAHSTRNLVMASVQRSAAAQHHGRRTAKTACPQFQWPRLHFAGGTSPNGFLGDTVYPSAQKSGAAKTLSSSQGVCGGLGGCPVSGRQPGSGARLCRPVAPHLARCIGGSVNRLCSGGSTRNTLPARVPLLSVPPRCSLRGCRPSPRKARWRWAGCRRLVLLLLSRAARRAGGGCAGLRGPGPCASWLPPVAWQWRDGAPPLAVSRAPPQLSSPQEQDQPPATPATSLPQPTRSVVALAVCGIPPLLLTDMMVAHGYRTMSRPRTRRSERKRICVPPSPSQSPGERPHLRPDQLRSYGHCLAKGRRRRAVPARRPHLSAPNDGSQGPSPVGQQRSVCWRPLSGSGVCPERTALRLLPPSVPLCGWLHARSILRVPDHTSTGRN